MPKSRNRGRAQGRPVQQRAMPLNRWNKWLAILPLIALLAATLIGLFSSGAVGGSNLGS